MKRLILLLLLLVSAPLKGYEINKDNDFQLWIFDSFGTQVTPCSRLFLESEFRWGDHASVFYFLYIQSRLLFTITPWLDIAPGYRQTFFLRTEQHTWTPSYQPFIEGILHFKWRGWEIRDRNRIQYIITPQDPHFSVYRNRLWVSTPWKWGRMQLNPVLFDEIFLRRRDGFFENRFGVGGSIPFSEISNLSIFYMRRIIKIAERFQSQNVLWFFYQFIY